MGRGNSKARFPSCPGKLPNLSLAVLGNRWTSLDERLAHMSFGINGLPKYFGSFWISLEWVWWRRRESNPTSVLKTLNLLILGMPALQEMQ
jgi:hypothetical protein